ncbi:hypothetical protein LQT97_16300 [Brucella pseudogrignonensis]|uniref:hypothetical protein n=1 Tax=Brucella pseudogrignonensis TaxID=419475 RepID=UPI001E46A8AE|nr:hypothetical protein [Brucella pseudogrignonensis]MCD4512790.1 hypothetical protein [Brucella pseudogrignonensis]
MTAPISNDLCERVVAAVLVGESVGCVARRFAIAPSSVVKWSQRHRATGSVRPGKMGGHRKRILEPHRDIIVQRLAENPHLTLHGPIEQAFSKIKHWMRNAQKRTSDDTWRHIGRLVETIKPDECQNYLENAGYGSVKR